MSKLFKKSKATVDNSAIVQQQNLENAKINARSRLNQIFGTGTDETATKRRGMYREHANAARDLNMKYLTEDRDDAAQQLRIAMARQGLGGGSTDIEQTAKLNRAFNEGVLDIGNQTDNMVNALEAADEQARLDLLDKINAGMDAESAASAANAALQQSANNAVANTRGRFIGNQFAQLFGTLGTGLYGQGANDVRGTIPLPAGSAPPATRRPRTFTWR